MKERKSVILEGGRVKRISGLLFNAYQDYLSARTLFNSGLLMSACCMSNQALEKQMKAFIECDENSKKNTSHNTVALLNILLRLKPVEASQINKEYIKVLNKIYDTRYFEKLPDGFKFEILKNKFLAELDYSYSILRPLVSLEPINNPKTKSQYDLDIEGNNPNLCSNNYIISRITKQDFLMQPEKAEEFVIFGNSYFSVRSDLTFSCDNGRFSYSGFRITSSTEAQCTDWLSEEIRFLPGL